MQKIKSVLIKMIVVLVLVAVLVGVVQFYPYIFAKTIQGEVMGVRYLTENVAIVTSSDPKAQPSTKVFSFSVGIKDRKTGQIITASSEDRQWGIVKEGQCATVKFFPYPPWKLDKDGTYFNARLEKLYESCEGLVEE